MRTASLALACLLLLAACSGGSENEPLPTATPPDVVTVDHILIGVKGPRIPNGKTPEAAQTLANDVMRQLEAGGDWAALKKQHSDDPPPGGPYTMFDDGRNVPAMRGAFPRSGMAPSFGDVAFSLGVGETGMAAYHPQASMFGFHIIKRIK